MKQITREQFTAAIEAGIAATDLEPQQEEALLLVALMAKQVGPNYNSLPLGCAATLAGLSCYDQAVHNFACGYDAYLRENVFSGRGEPFTAMEIV